MKKLLIGLAATTFLSTSALAQTPPMPNPPRSISVSGDSMEEVTPDQAILSMALVSKDKNLHAAKQHNDAMVEKLVAIAKQLDIAQEKIATSNIAIAPQYTYDNASGEQRFTDYVVSRSLRVTMDKLDVPEKLLSAIVDAKIDQVNGIEFRIADPKAREAGLRIKAFADAKAKADALAQAAGAKLGPALFISADGGAAPMPPRPIMPMMATAMRSTQSSVAPSLPGMVELRETVMVTFGLE